MNHPHVKNRWDLHGRRIWIAGHTGLVGSALIRKLSKVPEITLITCGRKDLDLMDRLSVEKFVSTQKPDLVLLAAGKVGGIVANSRFPAEFMDQNLMIEANVVCASWKAGVRRLLSFGCACMYPRECPQPMRPEWLMRGKLEETSEAYAMAKLVGMMLCGSYSRQYGVSYLTAIPSNLYGPGENFDLENAHVVAALLRRFHEAKEKQDREIVLWGSGKAKRDFLYVDDMAEAVLLLLEQYHGTEPVNIGSGHLWTIRDLAQNIAEVVGFRGLIRWDPSKPEGVRAKALDPSLIHGLGWIPRTNLSAGLEKTYAWFLEHRRV